MTLGYATGLATGGDGVYMNGNGQFRVGNPSGSFVKWDDTNLTISSDPLTLDSSGNLTISGTISSSIGNIGGWTIGSTTLSGPTNITLDAITNNGTISVGDLGNVSTTAGTNKGVIIDGNGNVLIKGPTADNNYIKFDADGGDGVGRFSMKTDGLSIIGGNLIASGTISASKGNIGGWTIDGTQLSSSHIDLKSSGEINLANSELIMKVSNNTSSLFPGGVAVIVAMVPAAIPGV